MFDEFLSGYDSLNVDASYASGGGGVILRVDIDIDRDGRFEQKGWWDMNTRTLVFDNGRTTDRYEWANSTYGGYGNIPLTSADPSYGFGFDGGEITDRGGGADAFGDEAARFASARINLGNLNLNDPYQMALYTQLLNAIETLYEKFTLSRADYINGPGLNDPDGQRVLNMLQTLNVTLSTADLPGGAGANYSFDTNTIRIDIDHQWRVDNTNLYGQEAGINYTIFHELGHSLAGPSQAAANTMGYALAGYAGMAYPSQSQLEVRGGFEPQ